MRIYTFNRGIQEGAEVVLFKLSGGAEIPAILLGESGRGRKLQVIPVHLFKENREKLLAGEIVRIFDATIGETQSGSLKLVETNEDWVKGNYIGVFKTQIGFRGGNSHTGDRSPDWTKEKGGFIQFPGEILAEGVFAQGDAGAMGSGKEIIALCNYSKIYRAASSGRLYGAEGAYYYKVLHDGSNFMCTGSERDIVEF